LHFKNSCSKIYIPDNLLVKEALLRTTHLSIAAHQDDIEIMSYSGISDCFNQKNKWFSAAVVTDGSGSPRNNIYSNYTDEEMKIVREKEQQKASVIGEYGSLISLNYPSKIIKDKLNKNLIEDLKTLIISTSPKIIYTHNLADKHDTHVAVALRVIEALRQLSIEFHPDYFYGCEVWRNLDWVNDNEKIKFDTSKHPNLASSLVEIFDSQICGGKRYDLAAIGRRLANATFLSSHEVDSSDSLIYGMNLKPLIENKNTDIKEFISSYIDRFKNDVLNKLDKL
jgi:LmbE family N-acetylglucosaminyl deacetylase